MNTPSKIEQLHSQARKGIDLFNQREFYQAHEPLEEAWMKTDSPERDLYQGLLQIGLAYFQITRGNYRGALKMFSRGHGKLAPLGEAFAGIDISRLQADALAVETRLRQLGPENIAELDHSLFKPIPTRS